MWPVLRSSCAIVRAYLGSVHCGSDIPLPSKSFSPSHADQTGWGPLIHAFSLPFASDGSRGAVSTGRRMVIPYQIWMLQRLEPTLERGGAGIAALLARFDGGEKLLRLGEDLAGCRLRKVGGRLYRDESGAAKRKAKHD